MSPRVNRKFPHLPEGREPGRQMRRATKTLGIVAWVFPIVGVIGGGVFVLVGLAAGWWFVPVGIVFAALFVFIPFWLRRQRAPGGAKHFSVGVDRLELKRGEAVAARLEVTAPDRIKGHLQVGLVCTCWYDTEETSHSSNGTNRYRSTNQATAYEQWQDASPTQPLQAFDLRVPPDAPFSHEGSCLSFAWAVRARADVRRRRDPVSAQPIWVAP